MESTIRTSAWTRRSCPICQRSDLLVEVGRRRLTVHQRTQAFEWRQIDGVCSGCGLIQGLEAPEPEFLNAYYGDAHTVATSEENARITPGFDSEARLSPIRRFHRNGLILEIGAGDGTFCDILRMAGYNALGVDPLDSGHSELVIPGYANSSSLGAQSASAVIAYDVMEHAIDPREWLESAASLLDPGGLLILEVPDAEQWPVEAWHHEHLTQFTKESLRKLCERVGFETVSCGVEPPSRPHGITYVGLLTGPQSGDEAVLRAQQLYARADLIRSHQQMAARETAERVISAASSDPATSYEVVVWGANEIASAIGDALEDSGSQLTVRIVDNADSKAGVPHPGFRTPVQRPEFSGRIGTHFIFVLCSRVWNEQIAAQITEMGLASFVVIDGTNWPAE